jgi:hypothetical protein
LLLSKSPLESVKSLHVRCVTFVFFMGFSMPKQRILVDYAASPATVQH